LVTTRSGAQYLIEITMDLPATMLRSRTPVIDPTFVQADLFGDDTPIALAAFAFQVGAPGSMMFWDETARNYPGYGRIDGPYRGTLRRTTPVASIEIARVALTGGEHGGRSSV
jgi:hypothetical protein